MKAINIYREPYEEGLEKTGNLKLEGNKDIAVHNKQNGTYNDALTCRINKKMCFTPRAVKEVATP